MSDRLAYVSRPFWDSLQNTIWAEALKPGGCAVTLLRLICERAEVTMFQFSRGVR